MFDITLTMTYFAFLLGFGVLIANVLKKANVPDTFFLLILGLVLGPTVFTNPVVTQYISVVLVDVTAMGTVPDFLRILALIMVVFTGTFNLSFKVFKRFSDVSVNLALIGIIFNTIFLGFVSHFMFGFDLVYGFLLGAILGGTGTGVIYAFESVLSRSKKAVTIIKVESIFNSPLTVLLPILFLDLVLLEPGALFEPLKYVSQFWQMIAAGVGTGLIVGLAVSKLLKRMLREYTPLLLFSIALITYALAENVGGSGMLAVAICGLIAGNIVFPERQEVKKFDDYLSEMLRISVFTLLGAQVVLPLAPEQLLIAFVFFLIMFVSRPLFLIPTLGKLRTKFPRRDILLMSFVSPRGLAAAAMAPIVATILISIGKPGVADQMVNIIFLMILFSVLFSTVVAWIGSRERFYRKREIKGEEIPEPERPEKGETKEEEKKKRVLEELKTEERG